MAKRGPKGVKDPYEYVNQEFKGKVEGATDEQIKAIIAEVAMNDAALKDAKKKDQDLKDKREALKDANSIYADGAKANGQRIAYCRMILEARGKDSGDSGVDEGGVETDGGPAQVE